MKIFSRLCAFAIVIAAVSAVGAVPPRGVRTMCEAAELLWPGSARVKHWAGLL